MPNWCCTNWTLRGTTEEIHKLADIFNSLPGREDVMPNGFGKFWLGNLAVALGYNYEEMEKRGENMRGHLDSDDGACACALGAGVKRVAIAHNHPSGTALPSECDIRETDRLKKALSTLGISLVDHVIVAEKEFYSFSDEVRTSNSRIPKLS